MKITLMLSSVLCSGQAFEVVDCVVKRVPIPVVDDLATRQGAVCVFPDDPGAQLPDVRFCRLNVGSLNAIPLIGANSDGAHRGLGPRAAAGFEFAAGRKMNAHLAGVPRLHAWAESGCIGFATGSQLVPQHSRTRLPIMWQATDPRCPTRAGTESGTVSAIRRDAEYLSAGLAGLIDEHVPNLAEPPGSGTTIIANFSGQTATRPDGSPFPTVQAD